MLLSPAPADDWPAGILTQLQRKLVAFDGVIADGFGSSVAAWGDVIVVGAPGDDGAAGSVHIFERNAGGPDAWGLVRKITVTDAVAGRFGGSVAVHGDVLVVGAATDAVGGRLDQGSAYVFERHAGGPEAWGQVRKLLAPDAAQQDLFGTSVSVAGDVIAVGAPGKENEQGAAYLFHRGTTATDVWTRTVKVLAADGAPSDAFGQSVSLADGFVAVGAPGDNSRRGSAYVFERSMGGPDTWWPAGKLTASDGAGNDYFGRVVAMTGHALAIGAQGDDSFRGAVYVFEREADSSPSVGNTNRWLQAVKLTASDRTTNELFGCSVALEGGLLLCGARGDEAGHAERGAAYVFERYAGGAGAWGQTTKITVPDGADHDRFGCATALSGDLLVVGSDSDDGHAADSGSAYLFPKQVRRWNAAGRVASADAGYAGYFGAACSLADNGILAVGAPGAAGVSFQGAVDLFERDATNHAWRRILRIVPSTSNGLGAAVSVRGDLLVAGAVMEVGGGTNGYQGAAYLFERNASGAGRWGPAARWADADGEREDWFGCSVAVGGDTVVVGVKNDKLGTGAWPGSARLYQRHWGGTNAWGLMKNLVAPAGGHSDHFGTAVAMEGDVIAVGAPNYPVGAIYDAGGVYLFERNRDGTNAWGLVRRITSPSPQEQESFGRSLSLAGDLLAVGASGADSGGHTNNGAVHLFARNRGGTNAWGHMTSFYPTEPRDYEEFGATVCVEGDLVLVGTAFWGASNSVHVFSRHAGGTNAFGRIARLMGEDTSIYNRFGCSIAAAGGTVAVGAYLETIPEQAAAGVVYALEGLCHAPAHLMLDARLPPHPGFHAVLNNRYDLERSTNLLNAANWAPVPGLTNLPGTGATLWLTDSNAPALPRRFYRLKERNP